MSKGGMFEVDRKSHFRRILSDAEPELADLGILVSSPDLRKRPINVRVFGISIRRG
jgi:hypothetical protein